MLRTDIQFLKPGPALSVEDVADASRAIGRGPWPRDYEHYLLRFNGAAPTLVTPHPDRAQFVRLWWPVGADAAGYGHNGGVEAFHRLRDDPTRRPDLLDVNQLIGHRFPPHTFAFANSDGGSRFLFDLRPDRHGQILFWCRPREGTADEQAQDPYRNVAWVADNLVDFFNRIEEEPDDWDAWEVAIAPDSARDWHPR